MKLGERNAERIVDLISKRINEEALAKIDYVEIVDSLTMEKVDKIEKTVLVAIAVFIGKTRLIDNFTYEI